MRIKVPRLEATSALPIFLRPPICIVPLPFCIQLVRLLLGLRWLRCLLDQFFLRSICVGLCLLNYRFLFIATLPIAVLQFCDLFKKSLLDFVRAAFLMGVLLDLEDVFDDVCARVWADVAFTAALALATLYATDSTFFRFERNLGNGISTRGRPTNFKLIGCIFFYAIHWIFF